jgi:alkanesulfonate monooxygenase SsuD/methylene tetrahydromethanopterin reductase-like flavin-dependent oxidoreductase (luciferase family)
VTARVRPSIRTGLCVTTAGRPGVGPGELVAAAGAVERAGLDAFLLDAAPPLDPYVVLGAVAVRSERLALGCLGEVAGARPPSVLAKTVTTLDVVSGGRALLGLAPPAAGGLLVLADALEIGRAMARVDAPSFAGSTAAIHSAHNEPRAGAAGPTPILLDVARGPGGDAASGADEVAPEALIALAARFCEIGAVDVAGYGPADGSPPLGATLLERYDAACLAAGRLAGELALLVVCDLETAGSDGAWPDPEELLERVRSWRAAGAAGVIVRAPAVALCRATTTDVLAALAETAGP